MLLMLAVGAPSAALAQQRENTVDTTRWTTVTTDTGDLAPGHQDFTRYHTPLLCRVAVHRTRDALQRTRALQAAAVALSYTPEQDTLPAGVAVVARGCLAEFTIAQTAVEDLPKLFDLALLARELPVARTVLNRWLATAPTDSVRSLILVSAIRRYLAAQPAQHATADSLLAQLETRGSETLIARLLAHDVMLKFWRRSDSLDKERQEADAILAIADQSTGNPTLAKELAEPPTGWMAPSVHFQKDTLWPGRPISDALWTYLQRAEVQGADSVEAVLQLSRTMLSRIRFGDGRQLNWAKEDLTEIASDINPYGRSQFVDSGSTPPIDADFWFPTQSNDTVAPALGRVSLIYVIKGKCDGDNEVMYWSSHCSQPFEQLQRWRERYGAAGLQITVFSGTHQYRQFGEPEEPAAEAQEIAEYVHTYWHLPVTVAVKITPPFVNRIGLNACCQGKFVLTGRDGRMSLMMDPAGDQHPREETFLPEQLQLLDKLIATALSASPGPMSSVHRTDSTPSTVSSPHGS